MKYGRFTVIIILYIAIVGSFYYSLKQWRENKADIIVQFADLLEDLALPYRLAKLELEPRDEKLLVPLRDVPVRQVADTWGAARSQGRTHEGTDIFAARGTPVYSATPGIVVRAGVNDLGGKFVMVAGAGGYRYYYAHLDALALGIDRGERVTIDTVLGFVGNTGNASNTPPHLHFGMYKRGAENPYSLLFDRE